MRKMSWKIWYFLPPWVMLFIHLFELIANHIRFDRSSAQARHIRFARLDDRTGPYRRRSQCCVNVERWTATKISSSSSGMHSSLVFSGLLTIGSFVSQDVGVGVVSDYKRGVAFDGSHFILLTRLLDHDNVNKSRKAKYLNQWLHPNLQLLHLRRLRQSTSNVLFAWRISLSKKWAYPRTVSIPSAWHVSWNGRR